MFALGLLIGIVGMLVHQSTHALSHIRWEATTHHLQGGVWHAFGIKLGISSAFLFVAVFCVAIWPDAGGSGIPEVMGDLKPKQAHEPRNKGCCNILTTFLAKCFSCNCVKSEIQGSPKRAQEPMKNGCNIIKTLVGKFVSCIFAVSSGLPVGPEGPMIHMGGLIGDGFVKCYNFMCTKCSCLKELDEEKDRLDFISAGVAAGVASAFGAPIGGLLFSIEEMSSSWKSELTWKTFFCCTVACFTTNFFNSYLNGFQPQRAAGLFEIETKFQLPSSWDVSEDFWDLLLLFSINVSENIENAPLKSGSKNVIKYQTVFASGCVKSSYAFRNPL
ncbi:chloride channel protein A-like [Clavelina lepadiformis]|uniref:chloride channel protein A-like n=1 Tax=Clavelina lepadiformis TaxID=159417 RepID=UPI004041CA74